MDHAKGIVILSNHRIVALLKLLLKLKLLPQTLTAICIQNIWDIWSSKTKKMQLILILYLVLQSLHGIKNLTYWVSWELLQPVQGED